MADEIIVNLDWVVDLKDGIDRTVSRMRAQSEDAVFVTSRPDVDSKTTDFMNEWDKRRDNVADCIEGCAAMLQVIHEAFTQTQDELIAAIEGDGG